MKPIYKLDWQGGLPVWCLYRIVRHRDGRLVYRFAGRFSYYDHTRPRGTLLLGGIRNGQEVSIYTLRLFAGFDPDTPEYVVRDWWEEQLPTPRLPARR